MQRALAAAALILISLPFPASSSWASQAQGTLTIDTKSSDVWFSVNVKGVSAPAPSNLADAAGEHVAQVAATLGACPARVHATQRDVGLTGPAWCVHVSGLQAGYSVSGIVASRGTSLSLTVRRKDTPGWPLAWSIIALLAAVVISWLSSTYVPGLTSRLRRRWYQHAKVPTGLGVWVKRAAASRILADDDIVARAQWARKYGIGQVTTARQQLARALADPAQSVPANSPLRQACQEEANRPATDVKCEDVLTDEGARSIKAATLLETLTKADNAIREFKSSADRIIAPLPNPSQERTQATATRDNALRWAEGLSDQGAPQFVETLNNIIASMLAAPGAPAVAPVAAAAISGTAVRAAATEIATSIKETLWPALYLPAVLLALIVMAGTVATVFAAQYTANPSFGTRTDYLTLILSAYGSAQVTAIVAALLLVRTPKPWYG